MPISLKREGGEVTPFRNAEYLPAYYFMPAEILSRCGKDVNTIPRNPQKAFRDKSAVRIIESDLFNQLMMDGYAYMVWPHMGVGPQMEIYSGYEPAWILAHSPAFWVQQLTDSGVIPKASELLRDCNEELRHVSSDEVNAILSVVVPEVMEKHNMGRPPRKGNAAQVSCLAQMSLKAYSSTQLQPSFRRPLRISRH